MRKKFFYSVALVLIIVVVAYLYLIVNQPLVIDGVRLQEDTNEILLQIRNNGSSDIQITDVYVNNIKESDLEILYLYNDYLFGKKELKNNQDINIKKVKEIKIVPHLKDSKKENYIDYAILITNKKVQNITIRYKYIGFTLQYKKEL